MLCLDHLIAQARAVRDEDLQLSLTLLLVLVQEGLVRVQTCLTLGVTGLRRHIDPFQLTLQGLTALADLLLFLSHTLRFLV